MKVIVTCGPSYEPVDEVRWITNFSTGELGALLSAAFAAAGFETICLRGVAATHPVTPAAARVRPFTTNDDLAEQLKAFGEAGDVAGVFHAAALCDYRVRRIEDADGHEAGGAKIASRSGALTIRLEPATKLIAHLRDWFPSSLLVGWKYELDGTPSDAINKARHQVIENRTDACIVNGRAYDDGFGFVQTLGCVGHVGNKDRLCAFLVSWLQESQQRSERLSNAILPNARLQTAA